MIETCPNCGADVPRNAKACPECGSCEKTGWSERAQHDDLGLPDDSFNYDEFVREEFGGQAPARGRFRRFWWILAAIVLASFVVFLVR